MIEQGCPDWTRVEIDPKFASRTYNLFAFARGADRDFPAPSKPPRKLSIEGSRNLDEEASVVARWISRPPLNLV